MFLLGLFFVVFVVEPFPLSFSYGMGFLGILFYVGYHGLQGIENALLHTLLTFTFFIKSAGIFFIYDLSFFS